MKIWKYILPILLLCPVLLCAQYYIVEISIHTALDTTYVQIFTNDVADFKKFYIDNPPKLGVDFFGAIYNLDKKEYLKVPPGIIMAVRGSQYKSAPDNVARIVLDLVEMPKNYDVRSHPEGVMIAIHTPGYPPVEKWTTGRIEAPEAAVIETTETTEVVEEAVPESVVTETVAVKDTISPEVALEVEEIPEELAVYMRPETLTYKGVTADQETIEVAKYIRNMVLYNPRGDDPFVAPKPTKEAPIGKEPVPIVEKLSVVGIVRMGEKNVALMQDESGFGFVIMPGDTVEDGICTAVTDTSAKFDLVEFGQVRKVEIPLVKPK